ncbi:malonyl-[acyl-carrier protein] O-methyltransferase BioC [Marinobacter vinifirmus]|uniref:Malonyl-[acyl-carrier protein] O-methyltransferase n=1 Tax=Marinobacter vinifirmus TaxID=355591 RepID=A0A7Z1IPD0_9GAMM|nr:malonyl-ACP O-methyltransferase BioC [Marinobacter vinifirmus]OZC37869.1 malonyl-[acyl-carrier protein] O-methyltransferase BioC [Marinobacter vinifirmus]
MSAYTDLTAIARSEGGTGSKACIARGFGSASQTYDSASRLQKAMGDTMLARIPENFEPTSILDLGCGTGWFTRKLANQYPNATITGADLASGMLQQARSFSPETITWLNADAEQLPLADNSADLIFSNLMIQWSTRPDTVLAECQRILKPGGTLAISTLLDGTLEELKQAWTKADPGQPHVNRFTHHADWQQLTSRQLPGSSLETATLTLPYDSPMALNRELKHLGAVFKGEERRRTVTAPGRFRAMSAAYPTAENGEIIASYHAGWLYWSKLI